MREINAFLEAVGHGVVFIAIWMIRVICIALVVFAAINLVIIILKSLIRAL